MAQSVTVDFNANLARFTSGVDKAISDLNKFQSHAQRITANINSALGAIGLGLSGAGVVAYGKAIIDLADEMNDLSQRIGINVKDLAGWELAARQSGTTMESVAKGVKGLSSYMVENNVALKAAGISATDANGVMIQLADLFSAMPDGIEKTNLAVKVFGKAGMDMIPMLNLGSEGLREAQDKAKTYGERLAELAPKADAFNDALEEMALHSRAVGVNLGTYLIGPLASVVDFGTKAAMGIAQLGSSLAVVANDLVTFGQVAAAAMAGGLTEEGQQYIKQKLEERRRFIEAANEDMVKRFSSFNAMRDRVDAAFGSSGTAKTGTSRGLGGKDGKAGKSGGAKHRREFDPEGDLDFRLSEMREKALRAGFDARDKQAADQVERLNNLLAATPTGQLEKAREEMQFLAEALEKNVITEEQYLELVGERYGKAKENIEELDGAARDLGFTFSSAFEDAIVGGKDLSSVLQGLAQDVTRIFVRKTVTEPLGESLAGAFKGMGGGSGLLSGIKNMFTFDGGGYTGAGSRSGGLDGKGGFMAVLHPNETVTDHTKGGATGGVTIVQNINIDSRSDQGTIAAAMVQAKNAAVAEVHNAMRRGSWA